MLNHAKQRTELPASYLRALWAFYNFTKRTKAVPSQTQLAGELGKSKSTARQALDYLTVRGYLDNTGKPRTPWVLTDTGKKMLRRTSKTISA